MGPTGDTPKKGSIQSPTDVHPNSKTGLGTESKFHVPSSPPRAKGSVVSPTDCQPDSKTGLGTEKMGK